MRTCLDRLIAQPRMNGPAVRDESEYVTSRLEQCRHDKIISNDAFLDAGVIQGALEMIANHIDMGVSLEEVQDLIRQQIGRAERLEEKHPGLDNAVESGR
ncbi:MAG: hypothetical protein ACKVG2_06005 [Candidatus Poseidoniales archaeon]|jgi:hypothetical protein